MRGVFRAAHNEVLSAARVQIRPSPGTTGPMA